MSERNSFDDEIIDQPPTDANEQEIMLERHPIRNKDFMVVTPEILRATALCLHAVHKRWTCCNFVGTSRVGKTKASNYVSRAIRESFGNVLVLRRNSLSGESRTASAFCEMLDASDMTERDLKRSIDARRAAARNLDVQARSSGASHVVLVADEANNLTTNQFRMLADITNEMELGITFIGFGLPTLIDRKNLFLQVDAGYLVARFLNLLIEFSTIASEEELKRFMSLYDDPTQLEFPAGSGWSISRFFFPNAWKQGWRLSQEAAPFWRAFEQSTGEGKKKSGMQISTECVTTALKSVLIDCRSFDFTQSPIDPVEWEYGVAQSQFQPSIGWSKKHAGKLLSTRKALVEFGIEVPEDTDSVVDVKP